MTLRLLAGFDDLDANFKNMLLSVLNSQFQFCEKLSFDCLQSR